MNNFINNMFMIFLPFKKSIFFRLALIFFVVMIPIYALGISIYDWGMRTVRAEISNSMISEVAFYLNNLEKEVERIKLLQYDTLVDENLNKLSVAYSVMDEYEKSQTVLNLQKRLFTLKNSSVYIENVNAFLPSVGKVISATGGVDDIPVDEFQMLMTSRTYSSSQIILWKNRLFLSASFPFSIQPREKMPLLIVAVELSKEELRKALLQFNRNAQSGSFIMDTAQNYIITNETSIDMIDRLKAFFGSRLNSRENSNAAGSIVIDGKRYLAIYSKSNYLGIVLCKYIPEDDVFKAVKKYQFWFWIFSLVSGIIVVVFLISTRLLIQQPLQKLVRAFGALEDGNLDIVVRRRGSDEFAYLFERFNSMADKLRTLINQVYKQKILMQRAELKQLQSQINPHFLYNSFFILSRMIKGEDFENSMRFCRQMGDYFQFITRSAADEVPISKEVEHARVYTDIQAIRFSKRIHVEFEDLPEQYKDIIVPRLIIQPIIENAFEHGLKNKVQDGLIKITFHGFENGLKIIVEDNGDELTEDRLESLKNDLANADSDNGIENTGIINIHRRLRLKFGKEAGLNVSRGEFGGLKVEINIIAKGDERDVQLVDSR